MKLSKFIKSLQEKQKAIKGDPEVVVDHEEDVGWFNVEKVQVIDSEDEIMINIKSSNEN